MERWPNSDPTLSRIRELWGRLYLGSESVFRISNVYNFVSYHSASMWMRFKNIRRGPWWFRCVLLARRVVLPHGSEEFCFTIAFFRQIRYENLTLDLTRSDAYLQNEDGNVYEIRSSTNPLAYLNKRRMKFPTRRLCDMRSGAKLRELSLVTAEWDWGIFMWYFRPWNM